MIVSLAERVPDRMEAQRDMFKNLLTGKRALVAGIGDNRKEPNETFFINLSNAVNASILDGQGVGTILNDD